MISSMSGGQAMVVGGCVLGEYSMDVTCLHEFPPLDYCNDKPSASLFTTVASMAGGR
jgi:hypothetical protein